MKNTFLVFSLLIICACANNSGDSKPPASADAKASSSYFPGSFYLYTPGQDVKNPVLPAQLILDIQEGRIGHEIVFKDLENTLGPKTGNENMVSVGCGLSTDIEDIPQKLEVDTLILCGEIKYSGPALELVANHVIMTKVRFTMTRQTPEQPVHSEFRLSTNLLTLIEDNSLQFAGATSGKNRNLPPHISLSITAFAEGGTLKITSLAAERKN